MKYSALLAIVFLASALAISGCATGGAESPIPEIPLSAIEVKEGPGRLFFQSSDPGTIFVYDADTAKLVFSQSIQTNQRFVLDPTLGVATIEGVVVMRDPNRVHGTIETKTVEKPIDKKHSHRIYFQPGGPTTKA